MTGLADKEASGAERPPLTDDQAVFAMEAAWPLQSCMPPLARSLYPVTHRPASVARNATTSAMSSGVPTRLRAVWLCSILTQGSLSRRQAMKSVVVAHRSEEHTTALQ